MAAPGARPVLISPTGSAGSARARTAKCIWQGTAWPPHRGPEVVHAARGPTGSPPPGTQGWPEAGEKDADPRDAKQRLQPRPCWGSPLAFGLVGGFTGQRCERVAGAAPRVPPRLLRQAEVWHVPASRGVAARGKELHRNRKPGIS